MKKMVKSLLVSGLVLASPLVGVVGGQEVNAQTTDTTTNTEVYLNVTEAGELIFTNTDGTDPVHFDVETTFADIVNPNGNYTTTVDSNFNTFTVSFKDDRRYTNKKTIVAQFAPNTGVTGVGITLAAPAASTADAAYNAYAPVGLVETAPVITDAATTSIYVTTDDVADNGKGTWDLAFEATDLVIPKSNDIVEEDNYLGDINWTLSSTK